MGTRVKKKTSDKESMDFKEVKTVYSDSECNELLKKGWSVIYMGVSHIDTNGFNTKPTFLLGLPKP